MSSGSIAGMNVLSRLMSGVSARAAPSIGSTPLVNVGTSTPALDQSSFEAAVQNAPSAGPLWSVSPSQILSASIPTYATSAQLLVDGSQIFPSTLRDLNSAQKSIEIIQYGFREGDIGEEVAHIL